MLHVVFERTNVLEIVEKQLSQGIIFHSIQKSSFVLMTVLLVDSENIRGDSYITDLHGLYDEVANVIITLVLAALNPLVPDTEVVS